jgi:hypothetical protein
MDNLRSQQTDPRMMMFRVIPGKESLTEPPGIFRTAESLRKVGSIFQGFKLGFGIRVVITGVWPEWGRPEGGHPLNNSVYGFCKL